MFSSEMITKVEVMFPGGSTWAQKWSQENKKPGGPPIPSSLATCAFFPFPKSTKHYTDSNTPTCLLFRCLLEKLLLALFILEEVKCQQIILKSYNRHLHLLVASISPSAQTRALPGGPHWVSVGAEFVVWLLYVFEEVPSRGMEGKE